MALELTATDQENFQIEQQQLHQGLFFFLLENESGLVGKGSLWWSNAITLRIPSFRQRLY